MKKKWVCCMLLSAGLAGSMPITGKALEKYGVGALDKIMNDLNEQRLEDTFNPGWDKGPQGKWWNSEIKPGPGSEVEPQSEIPGSGQPGSERETNQEPESKRETETDGASGRTRTTKENSETEPEGLYYDLNKNFLKNGIIGDYFIDIRGGRLKNAWVYQNGERFFLGEDGERIRNFKGGWYRIGKRDYYYTPDGRLKKGWLILHGDKYYLDEVYGVRVRGWREVDKKRYYFSPETGRMAVNEWVGDLYVGRNGTVTRSLPEKAQIHMKNILQNPELPTGCESVALAIVLRFYNFPVAKTTIADQYLEYSSDNFVSKFVGNPRTKSGAGCFAPAITNAANQYLKDRESDLEAEDLSGMSLSQLYSYLADGKPVLVWNTMYMVPPQKTGQTYTENGKTYYWFRKEHCVVLCGYDKKESTVTVNDPLEGLVIRDAEDFASIYDEMGQMAVVIQ